MLHGDAAIRPDHEPWFSFESISKPHVGSRRYAPIVVKAGMPGRALVLVDMTRCDARCFPMPKECGADIRDSSRPRNMWTGRTYCGGAICRPTQEAASRPRRSLYERHTRWRDESVHRPGHILRPLKTIGPDGARPQADAAWKIA